MRILLAALVTLVTLASPAAERLSLGDWRDPVGQGVARRPALGPTVDLIVRFRQPSGLRTLGPMSAAAFGERQRALETRVEELGRDVERLEVRQTFSRVLFGASVRVPRELRARIAALPYVASVTEERKFVTLSASVSQINADKVWMLRGTRGAGITVAIIDTGVDYTHPALGGGFGDGFKVIGGWDFVDGDADPMDTIGHGTHVAGIVAANGGDLVGVAPEASLIAYKVIGPGGGSEAGVIAAIERAVDPDQNGDPSDHVDVVNMSIGGPAMMDDPTAAAVEAATTAGIVFCISAGNGAAFGAIATPGTAPSAITAGASDDQDHVAWFSSRGPSYAFGIKPEVVAPGVEIVSSVPGGKAAEASGTSMASPHVAGVAALLRAAHPQWTPAEVKAAIVTSTVLVEDDVMARGAGRIDALAATSISTLALPALVQFGQADPAAEVWSASRTVTLRNLLEETQTLTAAIHGERAGVDVQVTPATVTLAPGESKTVSVDIAVTNKDVPAPKDGSLSFGGRVDWSGGDVPIHVPWAFVKAAFLTLEVHENTDVVDARIMGSTRRTSTDLFWWQTRVLWPLEKVDVAVREFDWPARILFAEEVDLSRGDVLLPLHFSSAQHTIAADTTDEVGQPLGTGDRLCQEEIVFGFPGGKVSNGQIPEGRGRFNTLSERVKIYLNHSCSDVSRSAMWSAIHEPFRGLQSSVTSTARPDWLRQNVQFFPAVDQQMTGIVPLLRFPGPESTYFLDGGQFYLMRETSPQFTIFFNRSPAPEVDLMTMIERWGRCYEPTLGHDIDCPVVANVFLYLNEREVTADSDVFLEISPTAYRLPVGSTMTFGSAPAWPQIGFVMDTGFWLVYADWKGPLGERRVPDCMRAHTTLFDGAGNVLGDGTGGIYKYETLPPGPYRMQSVDTHFAVGGIPSKATVNARLDTTRRDPLYPLLTGVRIVDGDGRQVTTLDRGGSGALVFSVADLLREAPWIRRVPPREEATRVEYRVRGMSDWRPLPATIEARHYQNNTFLNAGVGTVYRADLSALAREIVGPVDLRLHVEDAEGNDVELVLEPAFSIGEPRRRTVRH